jgi:hypothetical protein
MVFTANGQRCENVYHVQQDSPFDETSLAILCALFVDWWDDNFKANTPTEVSLTMVIAKALDTDSSPGIEYTTGLPLQGSTAGGIAMPNNVTVAVKWQTGLRGRSYRGRTFHIGLKENDITGNQVVGGVLTALTSGYTALITALTGLPSELVVLSRYHNNAPRVTAVATEVSGCSIDANVDSQRRRLTGRGT